MGKGKVKAFVAGVLATLILMNVVIAGSVDREIRIFYNNIKLYIDDSEYIPLDVDGKRVEPFIYNGTTYLPVRAVAKAFNEEVNWDQKTSSIYLGNHGGYKSSNYIEDQENINYQSHNVNSTTGQGNRMIKWNPEVDLDNTSKNYAHGLSFYMDKNAGENNYQYVEYLLDERYKSFKGTFTLHYNSKDEDTRTFLDIYGDDKLLYSSSVMLAGVLPIDFNVDVTGVTKLKVMIMQAESADNSATYSLVNAEFYE